MRFDECWRKLLVVIEIILIQNNPAKLSTRRHTECAFIYIYTYYFRSTYDNIIEINNETIIGIGVIVV